MVMELWHQMSSVCTKFQADSSKTFLSYDPETEFDFCDLCDDENQGQVPKTSRLPQGPMGKLYTIFVHLDAHCVWAILEHIAT